MAEKRKWTFMVYLAGDNDLSEAMTRRMLDMRAITGQVQNLHLLAFYDGNNPTRKTRYENMTPAAGSSGEGVDPIKLVGETNSGSPWTIKRFVEWCIWEQEAVADNYALIISGHGDGFQKTSFLQDATSMGYLSVGGLKQALKEIQTDVLRSKDGKFQLLCFDSCVMNTFEIAIELRGQAETLVGSQGFMPINGWSYREMVSGLIDLDKKDALNKDAIIELLIDSSVKPNAGYAQLDARCIDLSAFDLDPKLLDVASNAIHDLGEKLLMALTKTDEIGSRAELAHMESIKRAILSAHWRCQTLLYEQSIDIIDFCLCLKAECFLLLEDLQSQSQALGHRLANGEKVELPDDLSDEARSRLTHLVTCYYYVEEIYNRCHHAAESVRACVLKSCYSGPDYQFSNGMSLYFPWTLYTLRISKKIYEKFEFAFRSGGGERRPWYAFLHRYLHETMRRQPPEYRYSPYNAVTNSWAGKEGMIDPPDIMIDSPDQGMLSGQYKKYFGRIKNVVWDTENGCSK